MTELDQLTAILAVAEDVRRIVEIAGWCVMVGVGFVIAGVMHRLTRGR